MDYNEANPPSFIYGNNNISEFNKLKPPRTNKIGPHLLPQDDNMSAVPIDSIIN